MELNGNMIYLSKYRQIYCIELIVWRCNIIEVEYFKHYVHIKKENNICLICFAKLKYKIGIKSILLISFFFYLYILDTSRSKLYIRNKNLGKDSIKSV